MVSLHNDRKTNKRMFLNMNLTAVWVHIGRQRETKSDEYSLFGTAPFGKNFFSAIAEFF